MAWWRRRGNGRAMVAGARRRRWGASPPEVARFAPAAVDETDARQRIEAFIGGLTPESLDEATGHSLDNLVNSWAEKWVADVLVQYATYHSGANYRAGEALAALDKQARLRTSRERDFALMDLALEAAVLRMAREWPADQGDGQPGGQQPAGQDRPPGEWHTTGQDGSPGEWHATGRDRPPGEHQATGPDEQPGSAEDGHDDTG